MLSSSLSSKVEGKGEGMGGRRVMVKEYGVDEGDVVEGKKVR